VRLDALALVVEDRAGLQVVRGHPKRPLDLVQPVVGADDEVGVGTLRGQVGDVPLLIPTSA